MRVGEITMDLYSIFKLLNIEYKEIEHDPVFTIEQAQIVKGKIDGIGCKNLFLTDKKGKYILAVFEENKKVDIKRIQSLVSITHLSFAPSTELKSILNVEPGNVAPFGIINDIDNRVLFVIDNSLRDKKLLFHPNVNTKTISITFNDLIRFIEYSAHEYLFLE